MGSRINSGRPRNSSLTQAFVFYFSFREREKEKEKTSSPSPTPLRWRSIYLPRFLVFFYHARSTDFEEKIEDL